MRTTRARWMTASVVLTAVLLGGSALPAAAAGGKGWADAQRRSSEELQTMQRPAIDAWAVGALSASRRATGIDPWAGGQLSRATAHTPPTSPETGTQGSWGVIALQLLAVVLALAVLATGAATALSHRRPARPAG